MSKAFVCIAATCLAAASALAATVLDEPERDYASTDFMLELHALATGSDDEQPHILMSRHPGGPSKLVEVGELVVLRPATEGGRRFKTRVIDEAFTVTPFVEFAVGTTDRARYGATFGTNHEDLLVRLYDAQGSKTVDRLIERVGRIPTRLLAADDEFLLVTLHELLRIAADGTIVDRFKRSDAQFVDATLLPVKECPLVTLVVSGDERADAKLERRCLDASFTVRHQVGIAPTRPNRMPRFAATVGRPMAVTVGEYVAAAGASGEHEPSELDWILSTCDFGAAELSCDGRRISAVPFHVGQLLDGVQAVAFADRSVSAATLPKHSQSLWRGWYAPNEERPARTQRDALPTVPGGYTIGHRVLVTSAGGQIWTALAYMRVWGDKAPKGERPHSAADMHISLYKEPAPR